MAKPPFDQAMIFAGVGRFAQALTCVDQQLALTPRHAASLALKAALLVEMDKAQDALPLFAQAIALDPRNPVTQSNHGNALAKLGRPEEAVTAYGRALALDPGYTLALLNRAGQRIELQQGEAALADADQAVALNPGMAAAHRQRSLALFLLGRLEPALEAIDRALAIDGLNADSHERRGGILAGLGREEESAASFDRAKVLSPDRAQDLFQQSLEHLRRHRFKEGWQDHEHRWRGRLFTRFSSAYETHKIREHVAFEPRIEDVASKRILLLDEQGLGDQIMFGSMIPDLLAAGARPEIIVQERLVRLFRQTFPGILVHPARRRVDVDYLAFDKVVAIGSLGLMFRNAVGDFPGTPYLKPRAAFIEAWRMQLGPKSRPLRIGLCWRGGAAHRTGAKRSMTLETLRPLLERRDCEFVSLQHGEVEAEIAAVNATLEHPITFFPASETEDIEQLAALTLNVDLVVSVQTTLIHLSGALGVPCLVMIPSVAEWRYGLTGETMPWYRSVRLIRQKTAGEWTPVVEAVAAELDRRVGEASN